MVAGSHFCPAHAGCTYCNPLPAAGPVSSTTHTGETEREERAGAKQIDDPTAAANASRPTSTGWPPRMCFCSSFSPFLGAPGGIFSPFDGPSFSLSAYEYIQYLRVHANSNLDAALPTRHCPRSPRFQHAIDLDEALSLVRCVVHHWPRSIDAERGDPGRQDDVVLPYQNGPSTAWNLIIPYRSHSPTAFANRQSRH